MRVLFSVVSLLLLVVKVRSDGSATIRVLTFNTWNFGSNIEDGFQKLANHILYTKAEIVALQEKGASDMATSVANLTALLGSSWTGIAGQDTAILSVHKILGDSHAQTETAVGVRIAIAEQRIVSVWSLHLDYRDYGPYLSLNRYVAKIDVFYAAEWQRTENMMDLLALERFQSDVEKSDTIPLIVMGDFNCPSHEDWTPAVENVTHFGWTVQWPVTSLLVNATGLRDAYRTIYPDVEKSPGYTWSTVTKAADGYYGMVPEIQDRIDFIYFSPKSLGVSAASVDAGAKPIYPRPNHTHNAYPSDHYSVHADLVFLH